MRIAVLHSAFNAAIVGGLLGGALEALQRAGVAESDIECYEVPGAFELPLVALTVARTGHFDAIVALGAVIRGETDASYLSASIRQYDFLNGAFPRPKVEEGEFEGYNSDPRSDGLGHAGRA